jgi:hypothetical protein
MHAIYLPVRVPGTNDEMTVSLLRMGFRDAGPIALSKNDGGATLRKLVVDDHGYDLLVHLLQGLSPLG